MGYAEANDGRLRSVVSYPGLSLVFLEMVLSSSSYEPRRRCLICFDESGPSNAVPGILTDYPPVGSAIRNGMVWIDWIDWMSADLGRSRMICEFIQCGADTDL